MTRIKITKCIYCGQESCFVKAWHLWEDDGEEFFTMTMHCNACEKNFAKKFHIFEMTDLDLNPLNSFHMELLKLNKKVHKLTSKEKIN